MKIETKILHPLNELTLSYPYLGIHNTGNTFVWFTVPGFGIRILTDDSTYNTEIGRWLENE